MTFLISLLHIPPIGLLTARCDQACGGDRRRRRGGGEVAEGVALVRIGDVLPNDGGELLEIDPFFEEILYGIPIPVEKIGIELERLVNALVLEDLGCSCDLRGELRLRLSRRRYVSHDGPCRGAMGGLEPPDAPFLVARTLSNPQHRCDHWSSTR